MQIHDLILADYAVANEKGKFTLVGAGFTHITAQKFPCVHPLMFLFVRLKATRRDVGLNKIQIRLVGEKGSLFSAEIGVDVKEGKFDQHFFTFPIQLANIKFETGGDYNFEVVINGEPPVTQTLTVGEPVSQTT